MIFTKKILEAIGEEVGKPFPADEVELGGINELITRAFICFAAVDFMERTVSGSTSQPSAEDRARSAVLDAGELAKELKNFFQVRDRLLSGEDPKE